MPNARQQIEWLQQIESLQRRADKLSFDELGEKYYHLTKARSWLEMALSEYHESEGNNVVPAAINRAKILLDALEKNQPFISMDTQEEISGSASVRPDLWKKIATLKKQEKFSCGQRAIAQAEVHLVWSSHEKLDGNIPQSKYYARSAEDLIREAHTKIIGCVPLIPVTKKITLPSDELFESDDMELLPSARKQLDNLLKSIRTLKTVEEIVLIGHTDRLHDTPAERSHFLSEQRAESVKQYLVNRGIPEGKMYASGAGATHPLVKCSAKMNLDKQVACLEPNRRIEIVIRGNQAAEKNVVDNDN